MSELSWEIHHSLNRFFESLWLSRQPPLNDLEQGSRNQAIIMDLRRRDVWPYNKA